MAQSKPTSMRAPLLMRFRRARACWRSVCIGGRIEQLRAGVADERGMSKSPEQEDGSAAEAIPLELRGGSGDFGSFGELISTFRMCDEMNHAEFAKVLGVGELYLRDVEACRKLVGAEEAAAWAFAIGYPATVFVRRVLQDQLDKVGLEMRAWVEVAS